MNDRTTLRGAPVVVAPGKIFLVGEYGVLEGGSAVLTAVSCNAIAQYIPGLEAASPIVEKAVLLSREALGELASAIPEGSVLVDTGQFRRGENKIGVGSSAATAVATVGAVFEYCGRPVAQHRDEIFEIADAAHRAAQGGVGSGADVAVATYGGFLHFQRSEGAAVLREALPAPQGLSLVVFFSGHPASTVQMVRSVMALKTDTPPLYKWLMDELKTLGGRFVSALGSNNLPGVISATNQYHETLVELGSSARLPIVTPVFEAAATLARSLGGAAKPSGAGGGDLGIALFAEPEAATAFSSRCPEGLSVLDVRPEPLGVRRRVATVSEVAHQR